MYNVKNINSFILNDYIETINNFVGEEVIHPVNENFARDLNENTFDFLAKLAKRIYELDNKSSALCHSGPNPTRPNKLAAVKNFFTSKRNKK